MRLAVADKLLRDTGHLLVAQSVEYTAELLWRALCIGTPTVLSDEEMARVAKKFVSYGQPHKSTEAAGDGA